MGILELQLILLLLLPTFDALDANGVLQDDPPFIAALDDSEEP